MRPALALVLATLGAFVGATSGGGQSSCSSVAAVHWVCDFDASEARPLSDPDAAPAADGSLPTGVCQTTCGTPAHACTFTRLDGGAPGAICPVCTF